MKAKLASHSYGKSKVRVLKILREGDTHGVKEITVTVTLLGALEAAYTEGDNSQVVATDTMKNTVHALASLHLGAESEGFGMILARHFLERHPQIHEVRIEIFDRAWHRMKLDAAMQPHSFVGAQSAQPAARVTAARNSLQVESGIKDLLILKTTQSGFAGFPRCEWTTLPETGDRIFATSLCADWRWSRPPADYTAANHAIIDAMLKPFCLNYSVSVQATLFQMGEAALDACPEIERITLAMPNKHYLPIDLKPFGLEGGSPVFLPTEEPHGQIEATLVRA